MPLGLSWPYRKVYTPREVARSLCRFRKEDSQYDDCVPVWTRLLTEDSNTWRRVRKPLNMVRSNYESIPCEDRYIAPYVKRRMAGGRFPPVVLYPPETGRLNPQDGNHRVRAAQCVGDKTIDAFIPVRKPPKKR